MKKLVLIFTVILSTLNSYAQSQTTSTSKDADFSNFYVTSDVMTWQLTGIAHNETHSGLYFRITVNNNKEGGVWFPKEIYISGAFGYLYPVGLTINGEEYELGKPWRYSKKNKGKWIDCLLYFPRIPAGISSINYCEPNFINWINIPVPDNPDPSEHTQWTESNLRSYWTNNQCLPIEGIYYFTTTNDKEWWGNSKHTLAVKKDGYQYKVIYLKGSNPGVWQEGDVKAVFVPTATLGLYKATTWLMENKINNEDFYLKFDEGSMSIYENTSNITADFLKLYPAIDENFVTEVSSPINNNASNAQQANPTGNGSGIFVSTNVIATNFHVVENASKIEVVIKDDEHIYNYTAKVLSVDKINDLALLIIDNTDFKGIGDIPYSLSNTTKDVGTAVFTMGFPMANYMGEEVKITDGVISSKTGYNGDIVTYQISAPIQPGSSGGPLFDKTGNLIGITNAGIISAQNVGYAIKSSYLCNLIESAPISINIPKYNSIGNSDLTEQIKILSKFVTYIKVY